MGKKNKKNKNNQSETPVVEGSGSTEESPVPEDVEMKEAEPEGMTKKEGPQE